MRAAQFELEESAETRRAKMKALLFQWGADPETIEVFIDLVGLSQERKQGSELQDPGKLREITLSAHIELLEALAGRAPLIVIFEDSHWADATSLELLDRIVAWATRSRALLVITFRPEFQHAWGGEPHVTPLNLNRLAGAEGAKLVEELSGDVGLSREVVDEIVERADGVPLFVEELTKAVLESADGDVMSAASPSPAASIPATLHASLIRGSIGSARSPGRSDKSAR